MQSFIRYIPISAGENNAAVALGFFDGLHRGHRKVLYAAADEKLNGLMPVCLTFDESPKAVLSGKHFSYLMTRSDREKALGEVGMERVYFADFRKLMNLSAREFFEKILIERIGAKKLFCGFNYTFGRHAEGNTGLLSKLCAENGIELTVAEPETDFGEVVCSTLIKSLIKDGNIKRANALLCGSYGFASTVQHGKRLGRELGTPTLNQLPPKSLVMPKFGVYVSDVELESGEVYRGVTNVGIKPTVGGTTLLWETWMPDYRGGEIYGRTVDTRLLDFIRPEVKFGSLAQLKEEIIKNGEQAVRFGKQT